jgi:hypothetical protein
VASTRKEVGVLVGHRPELVDDDEQPRWREGARRTGVVGEPQRGKVGAPRCSELPLAPVQLGAQAGERTRGERSVQVRDLTDDMGEVGARAQARAALVVDQRDGKPCRWVGEGEREHERLQQCGLPGSRRAGHEGVRAVVHQIDGHGSVLVGAERRP